MDSLRTTVYIPLVELTDQANSLLTVYCDHDSEWDGKALDKEWHFIAAPLKPMGLYDDGLQALAAVKTLGLKRPKLGVYSAFKKFAGLSKLRLHSAYKPNIEGDSAQLGLALALLLGASNSPIRYTLATGKLSTDTQLNQHKKADVAIECVGSLTEKLRLIGQQRKNKLLPPGPLYCFTPYYLNTDSTLKVADLPEVSELAAVGIIVKPIQWLSEAAAVLKADTSRYHPLDIGLGLIAALALSGGLYWGWWHYPIQIDPLVGKSRPEPFIICSNPDLSTVAYYDLPHNGDIPLLPVYAKPNADYNISLAWRLRPAKTPFTTVYYEARIHLGEYTGFKFIDLTKDGKRLTIAANDKMEGSWPMNEVGTFAQDNVLIIALQRTAFETDAINLAFKQRFPPTEKLDVLAARDYLIAQFPGHYAFTYQSTVSVPPCQKSPP